MGRGARLYRHTQALMVRATTHPGTGVPASDVDLSGPGGPERGRAWLAAVGEHPQARQALEAASPVLSAQTTALLTAPVPSEKEVRRLVHSTAAYLLRWQGRATPFGYFAGVASARTGTTLQALWGPGHRAVLRPDAVWLGAVTDQLASHAGIRERLLVVANPAACARGGRIAGPGRTPADGLSPLEVSVAATGPVRTALAAATAPALFPDVAKAVAADYPHADNESVHGLLVQLLEHGVLLSVLDATATAADPLAQLRTLTDPAVTPGPLLAPTAEVTGSTSPSWPDTVLDAQVTIPAGVLSEAESAASVLARLSPYPFGNPAWRDFHQRFRQTYGAGAAVPVVELVGDGGLGFPPGFLGSDRPNPARMLSARDEAFLALAQQAALDGAREVALTEPLLASLAVVDADELVPPPSVELAFQLYADDADAVRRGRFELWLTSAARPSSSMAGRFADLLPELDAAALAAALAGPAGPLPAQLVFPARRRRSSNVIRTLRLLEYTISLGWPEPGPGSIPLDDLAVTCDARHLYLIRSSTGQVIEPRVLHALEPRVQTSPLARFLAEVAGARRTVWRLPDWGAASRLPFLPRLRHGRTVLAPARWLLAASLLPGPAAARSVWEGAFASWRDRQRVPARVVLAETELRLPLDLDLPLHRELLRARLDRAGEVEVREAPSPAPGSTSPSAGGFMGRAHEFLTVLHATAPTPAPAGPAVPAAIQQMPGVSRMVCAHLHVHPARQDEVLTEHLPRLLDGWSPAPGWWFTRHHDASHPYRDRPLVLNLHLDGVAAWGQAAERLGTWADELRGLRLASRLDLVAYRPQDGRYGRGAAREAAERVFAADSGAALAQIAYATRTGLPAQSVTAASLADLATAFAPCPADGWAWLVAALPRESGPVDAALIRYVRALTAPGAAWRDDPDAAAMAGAWAARADALAAYRNTLAEQREPMTVLRSLLHLHHVRALGGGPDAERVTHRLARTAALPHTHLRKALR
ncbi:lantibiotic dehydratase [Streptomyces spororaveus]|uniref:lantibiotic dehydratase n=1 Tax=Streptomyces spororaveus TaxID=284039 RepID=UPI00207A49E5|nr:lantibiotic dehydratase [Streptomyces spororaveus]MCM9083182.1 lantibiotic dehydratase [Streptomyces spororaveus]